MNVDEWWRRTRPSAHTHIAFSLSIIESIAFNWILHLLPLQKKNVLIHIFPFFTIIIIAFDFVHWFPCIAAHWCDGLKISFWNQNKLIENDSMCKRSGSYYVRCMTRRFVYKIHLCASLPFPRCVRHGKWFHFNVRCTHTQIWIAMAKKSRAHEEQCQ